MTQEGRAFCIRHAEHLQGDDIAEEIRWDKIFQPTVIYILDTGTEVKESDEDNTSITGAEGRCDDNNDSFVDMPLAVLLD